MNMLVLGLIFDIIGVSILITISIINPWYWKREDLKFGQKRYSWHSRRPFYKDTKTLKWKVKWNHRPIVDGFIPPKYKGNIFGFLLILVGFILQLCFYLH